MKETLKESLKFKTYKGVPLQSHHDIGVEILMNSIQEKAAREAAEATDEGIVMHIQRALPEVKIDKESLRRWIAMCKFLEENATFDDKTVIGQWLKATDLQGQNEKLRAENEKLKEKMERLHKAVEGVLYD